MSHCLVALWCASVASNVDHTSHKLAALVHRDVKVEGFHLVVDVRLPTCESVRDVLAAEGRGVGPGEVDCRWRFLMSEVIPTGIILDTFEWRRADHWLVVDEDPHSVLAHPQYLELPAPAVKGSFKATFGKAAFATNLSYPLHTRYQAPTGARAQLCLDETMVYLASLSADGTAPPVVHHAFPLAPVCWSVPTPPPDVAPTVSVVTSCFVWTAAVLFSALSFLK
ncbi:hypothetical protein DIPPA_14918 [Diplonema papillatum]|nr:hypothetical protein DIPPA_14918 [Diplonema papillatum]